MTTHLEIFLLGPFQVTLDGKAVTRFGSDTARALLAYLSLHPGIPHRRDALAGLLWPEHTDAEARRNLRVTLSRLRTAIGDQPPNDALLEVSRQTIQFLEDRRCTVDVGAMRGALAATRAHPHEQIERCGECAELLRQATALYRGEFLAGFSLNSVPFEEWMVVERESLHWQALEALSALADYYESQGDYEAAIDGARRQVELESWREAAHRQWIRCLALSGRRGAALAQYEVCLQVLTEELGVEPEPETQTLCEQIRSGTLVSVMPVPAPPPAEAPPSVVANAHPQAAHLKHNLPAQLTPFVGRKAELARIQDLLADTNCRLLTLVGPGGSGKTSLALQAARALLSQGMDGLYPDGIYVASLDPVPSVEGIVPTLAQAMGALLYAGREPLQQLLAHLRPKRMLLILDGFECLLDGTQHVAEILQAAPKVQILVTSRARLSLPGEHLLPVPGMGVPEASSATTAAQETSASAQESAKAVMNYDAIRLFLQCARRVRPDYHPTNDALAQIVHICQAVQGMPLAILLAAAWMDMLTPAEIAEQIVHPPTDRSIDFLAVDWRGMPARQQSMRAVFDRSWNLLSAREKAVMSALSVFRGGFTSRAAQQVAGASLHELRALIGKSLLHRAPTGRYQVHELLRQYAAEKLGQSPDENRAARDRHSAYYASALQRWREHLEGPRQRAARIEMSGEIENARAAWDWSVEHAQVEQLERALGGLCQFYQYGRYQEGETACRALAERLARSDRPDQAVRVATIRLWVDALVWQANFCQALGHTERARQLLDRGQALLDSSQMTGQDSRTERARVLYDMGRTVSMSEPEQARALFEQSLALSREVGNHRLAAYALWSLASEAGYSGDLDKVRRLGEECLAIRQALGDHRNVARSLGMLGVIALDRGEHEKGERMLREDIAILREIGDRRGVAGGLGELGAALLELGRFAEGCALLEESLDISTDLGLRIYLPRSHFRLGVAGLHLGRYECARAQGQTALTLSQEFGDRRATASALCVLGAVALVGKAYREAQALLTESVTLCQETGYRDQLSCACALLGLVACGLGHLEQARQHLGKALSTATDLDSRVLYLYALSAIALLLADQGEQERAVELYVLAASDPYVANSQWFQDVAGRSVSAAAAAALSPDLVAAAQDRGRARDLEAAIVGLAAEFSE